MSSHPSEGSGTNDTTTGGHASQTRSRRAKVWEFFEQELIEVDGVLKAVCKYCRLQMVSGKSGTNSLRNHIAEHCPQITEEDRQRFIATLKKEPSEGSFVFDPRRTRELLVKWCIHAEVPFNKFDDPYFPPLMESMQPTIKVVGRQTLRNDCVGAYERAAQELRVELQNLDSRICFTSDLWTSNQKLGYLCLTAHYIDSNFVLHKKIIAFRDVKYPHTGLAIEEAVRSRSNEHPWSRASAARSVGSPVLGKRKVQEQFAKFRSMRRGSNAEKSELDAYLEEKHVREDENFEILSWWKTNSNKYPVLSAMARDFLAIPVSTVSSESAFSCGGRILCDSRSSLTPKAVEALVCMKDWLYQYPNNEVKNRHDYCCERRGGHFDVLKGRRFFNF
ncbi:hypothetical protein ACP70R_019760 [Stipagrostis hirtigluma subsp. patula]